MSATEYGASTAGTVFGQNEAANVTQQEPYTVRSGDVTFADPDGAHRLLKGRPKRPARRASRARGTQAHSAIRTKRRLQGFLVELTAATNEARVAFVENEEVILYDLPADQLLKAEITVPNQPFQMDEVEMTDENGHIIFGCRFIALAKPSDAYIENLPLDDEHKRKRDLILRELGQAQD